MNPRPRRGAPTKFCPVCETELHAAKGTCNNCGHIFHRKQQRTRVKVDPLSFWLKLQEYASDCGGINTAKNKLLPVQKFIEEINCKNVDIGIKSLLAVQNLAQELNCKSIDAVVELLLPLRSLTDELNCNIDIIVKSLEVLRQTPLNNNDEGIEEKSKKQEELDKKREKINAAIQQGDSFIFPLEKRREYEFVGPNYAGMSGEFISANSMVKCRIEGKIRTLTIRRFYKILVALGKIV